MLSLLWNFALNRSHRIVFLGVYHRAGMYSDFVRILSPNGRVHVKINFMLNSVHQFPFLHHMQCYLFGSNFLIWLYFTYIQNNGATETSSRLDHYLCVSKSDKNCRREVALDQQLFNAPYLAVQLHSAWITYSVTSTSTSTVRVRLASELALR